MKYRKPRMVKIKLLGGEKLAKLTFDALKGNVVTTGDIFLKNGKPLKRKPQQKSGE